MAVKKQETEAAVQAAPEKDTEVIRLFKDNQRYKTPVFVGVNGETYLIQRGVDVEVPKAVAEVLRHSEEMDGEAMAKIVAAESARRYQWAHHLPTGAPDRNRCGCWARIRAR